MWYSALEVARYIISRCASLNRPISNLKLQKVLYFVWVDFYRKTGRMLFDDNICAWQLGPVVPEVYYEYCSYAGTPIFLLYTTTIAPRDREMLDDIISDYLPISANELVNRTHATGSAWDVIYKNGEGNRKVIPFDLIIEKEAS
ncbi:MAG: DUF4065 domain-containing protein [Lachnospiraceae bacterium]|nr:DUF4065 domain-containing protein [Lachnospiraceae bacterium]